MNSDTFLYKLVGEDHLTRPLKDAENQTRRLGNQVAKTNKQMGVFSSNLANARKGTRAFAMGSLQQAGYQVGDFAVQIANGTNKMQAFGQQAPQFLQIFGPIGSVVGAAVAVFAAAAVMIEKTRATAENLSKAVDKANRSITNFSESAKQNTKSVAQLAKDYGLMAAQAKEFFEVQNEINRIVAFRDVASAIELATETFGEFGDRAIGSLYDQGRAFDEIIDKINSLRREGEQSDYFNIEEGLNNQLLKAEERLNRMASYEVVKLAKELEVSGYAAAMMAEELSKAQTAENLEDRVKALVEIRRLYRDFALADGKLSENEQKRLQTLLDAQMSYLKISSTLKEINEETEDLLKKMDRFRPDRIYGGRGGDPRKQTDDYMSQMGYKSVDELIEELTKKGDKPFKKIKKEVQALSPEMKRLQDFADAVGNSFEDAMMSAVDGTTKAKDAFRLMARDIINELYRVFIVKKVTGFISSFITDPSMFGGMGQTTGVRGSSPRPVLRAEGGAYTGSGARAGGMDGKGGFMAMLHPRETVVDHTKGQGGGVTVVQNINVTTGVQQTVRTEIKSLMPQIADSAKSAVLEAKRRGGSYGRAFA